MVLIEISYKNDCEERVKEIVIKSTNYTEKLIQSQWTVMYVEGGNSAGLHFDSFEDHHTKLNYEIKVL